MYFLRNKIQKLGKSNYFLNYGENWNFRYFYLHAGRPGRNPTTRMHPPSNLPHGGAISRHEDLMIHQLPPVPDQYGER